MVEGSNFRICSFISETWVKVLSEVKKTDADINKIYPPEELPGMDTDASNASNAYKDLAIKYQKQNSVLRDWVFQMDAKLSKRTNPVALFLIGAVLGATVAFVVIKFFGL